MKVGNIVDGLAVIDVKRINKMNLIQFTKAVSEYIEQGYKIDVHSSRQIGLVLQCDLYKLESNLSGNVGSVGEGVGSTEETIPAVDSSEEEVVKEPNETTIKAIQESTEKLETVETIDEVTEEALSDLKEGDIDAVSSETEVEVEQATSPEQSNAVVKKTRSKKTT